MSQTVYWAPNNRLEAANYEVWSSADNVTFTLLVTIPVGTSGPNFDTNLQKYFYTDTVNPSTTWYKVRANDGLGGFSSFTISAQGEPQVLPTCRIYGRVTGFDGVPLAGAAIAAHIQYTAQDMSGQFIGAVGITSDNIEAYTDDEGNFEIDLVQNGAAVIEIATINLTKSFTVPVQDTANLIDLI